MNRITIWISLLLILPAQTTWAQYFGRNKPVYQDFDFKVIETPHFDVYSYLKDRNKINTLGEWSELWYNMHQEVLQDTFTEKNPILFYNDHSDFQQTNAISGAIGVGTGGVTEALKNRVVMPLTMTNQQTNHVLGHELVHAFQYHMILTGDSTNLASLQNLPLWMVEGLAEYMSLGRFDANTAMWMRDVVINDKVPTLKDLFNPEFFPYRYGQAFWAFFAGMYGDDKIKPFFVATAKYGLPIAVQSVLNTNFETLSNQFKSALTTYYTPLVADKKEASFGRKIITEENAGKMNISPVVSPNGRYVIFLSEKELITTDLYLADTRDGKIIRKVSSRTKDGHLDNINYLESSGTWSPDSKQFAFVAFKKGRNVLVIKDVSNGRTVQEIAPKNLAAFANPSWAPNGRSIVIAGLNQGESDLYQIDLRSKRLTQLTNDNYSQIQPSWSEDGSKLVFATDKMAIDNGRVRGKYTMNIAVMDMESKEITQYDFFHGADNLNPEFDAQGNIYFLSDHDGYRNLYYYNVPEDKVFRMTDYLVGISGITNYSPAISVSKKRDEVFYSNYFDGSYIINRAQSEDFLMEEVDPNVIDYAAATLPVIGLKPDLVNANLDFMENRPAPPSEEFKQVAYKPQFQLDYIGGSTGVGVGTSNAFGTQTGLAGGIDMLFSDILGNNQLYSGVALNGEIYDVAGVFQYINRKHRLAWGASLSHIPYRTGFANYAGIDSLRYGGGYILTDKIELNLLRIFEDGASAFFHYPFSSTMRIEGSIGTSYRYFRWDQYNNYYDAFGRLLYQDRERQKIDGDLNLGGYVIRKTFMHNANFAVVGDNSYFGLTSPLAGYRYRVGVEKYFGGYDFYTTLIDLRKYIRVNPVTFAFRAMQYSRFGPDASAFYPLFIGEMGLVHGYRYGVRDEIEQRYGINFNQLTGSKMAMVHFETRLPFTGPERLSLIKSKMIFTELNCFIDGGVAFDSFSDFDGTPEGPLATKPAMVFSTGLGVRVNLFGALIIEPYLAFPIQKNTKGIFGVNLVPGW